MKDWKDAINDDFYDDTHNNTYPQLYLYLRNYGNTRFVDEDGYCYLPIEFIFDLEESPYNVNVDQSKPIEDVINAELKYEGGRFIIKVEQGTDSNYYYKRVDVSKTGHERGGLLDI
jgi:hypothetical protein